jgi:hypothetical protein
MSPSNANQTVISFWSLSSIYSLIAPFAKKYILVQISPFFITKSRFLNEKGCSISEMAVSSASPKVTICFSPFNIFRFKVSSIQGV